MEKIHDSCNRQSQNMQNKLYCFFCIGNQMELNVRVCVALKCPAKLTVKRECSMFRCPLCGDANALQYTEALIKRTGISSLSAGQSCHDIISECECSACTTVWVRAVQCLPLVAPSVRGLHNWISPLSHSVVAAAAAPGQIQQHHRLTLTTDGHQQLNIKET